MKQIDSFSIIINFDGDSPRAKKKTSKIESDVETAVRYAKNRGRYEKNAKKYAKNLGLRAMLYCGRPLKSQATEQSMRRFFGGPLLGRPSAGLHYIGRNAPDARARKNFFKRWARAHSEKYLLTFAKRAGGPPAPWGGGPCARAKYPGLSKLAFFVI